MYFLSQDELSPCEETVGPEIYNELERFKYQCRSFSPGPCNLLEEFNTECLAPLGSDATDLELCTLTSSTVVASLPGSCELGRSAVLSVEQAEVSACEGFSSDFFSIERFRWECDDYTPTGGTCGLLSEFASACIGTEVEGSLVCRDP